MRIYQVQTRADAPRLLCVPDAKCALSPFDGRSKRGQIPREIVDVLEAVPNDTPLTFWSFEAGVLVYSEALYGQFLTEEDSPYYAFLSCGEFLTLKSPSGYYVALNPVVVFRDFDTAASQAPACDCQLFRLQSRGKAELYCLEGTRCPGNEFKHEYDRCGLLGLTFQEVWRQELEDDKIEA